MCVCDGGGWGVGGGLKAPPSGSGVDPLKLCKCCQSSNVKNNCLNNKMELLYGVVQAISKMMQWFEKSHFWLCYSAACNTCAEMN